MVPFLDHVVPRCKADFILHSAFYILHSNVWSAKEVNQRKADRLPHEAGLRLLSKPRAPRELPAMAFIRNPHDVADWKLFVED